MGGQCGQYVEKMTERKIGNLLLFAHPALGSFLRHLLINKVLFALFKNIVSALLIWPEF